ncbi:MAG: DUF349 domain-containing protein [Cyclobacteriaceae bacterium]|nr:DUF349 domain-containing protein [Cyclobacteriaceae bacterium]
MIVNENGLLVEKDALDQMASEGEALHGVGSSNTQAEAHLEEEESAIDFTHFQKADYVELAKELAKSDNYKRTDTLVKEMKPLFDAIRNGERKTALDRYIAEGGIAEDFEYRADEFDHQFDATLKLIRDKRQAHFKLLEDQKNASLHKKAEILEKLRTLVDGEDSPHAFHQFKELQKEWKNSGPVPVAHIKTMWANYNALVDRFYDHRNIYFELKELDRRKNLETKKELCVRAEKLAELNAIQEAVRELNELHNEFKHVGPVPTEEQEALWQRFKAASDAVYAKRDAFVVNLQQEFSKNLALKEAIGEELNTFLSFTSDRIKDWNEKTKQILELQKKWDAVGSVQRAKQKDINKKFWSAFKLFFHNKSVFFKKLDEERAKNLKLKEEIVAKALALKESTDWEKTSNELKVLQTQWKEVGPVPEKWRDKIYVQFKEACDFFFEQRRGLQKQADQEQEVNLVKKEEIIRQLQELTANKGVTIAEVQNLRSQFNALGFVPKHAMASIKSRFTEVANKAIASIENLSDQDKTQASLEIEISALRDDPQSDRKLFQREQTIRKQIAKAENDIGVLENNLTFFERSKNASQMKEEYGNKIKEATAHLKDLKKQLKMLQQPTETLAKTNS